MLNTDDLELLAKRGISEQQIARQISCFEKGFPYLKIVASASTEKGIMTVPQKEQVVYMNA